MPHLPVIAGALWRGRRLDIRYREGAAVVARRLNPLGLVLKAGVWYLLAERRREERVYRVSRIVSANERPELFARSPDFDLAAAWIRRSEAFERAARRSRSRCGFPEPGPLPPRRRVVEDGERPRVIAQFDGVDQALHSLLAWGALAEVLAPQTLRERIAAAAAETVALYAAEGANAAIRFVAFG